VEWPSSVRLIHSATFLGAAVNPWNHGAAVVVEHEMPATKRNPLDIHDGHQRDAHNVFQAIIQLFILYALHSSSALS
jgi:hypothetical protein